MKMFASLITIMLIAFPSFAYEWKESKDIEHIFTNAGIKGTFVLYDASNNLFFGHNKERAQTRFIPASTFKIPNTIIGLSIGAVTSVDEILPYGGGKCFLPEWERDMGLREAIAMSNVPIYQELARRIGLVNMKANIEKLNYGNNNIGKVIDTFWLSGPLKISPIEQTIFLSKLAQTALPFPKTAQKAVSEITLIESNDNWELHAKTGLLLESKPGIGWWVGWVVKNSQVYAFALNLEVRDFSDKDKRIPLGKSALQALRII